MEPWKDWQGLLDSRIARPSREEKSRGPGLLLAARRRDASCWDAWDGLKGMGAGVRRRHTRSSRVGEDPSRAGTRACWRWRCLREPASMLDLDGPLSGGQGRAHPCA